MMHKQNLLWRSKETTLTYLKDGRNLWVHVDGEIYLYTKDSHISTRATAFSFGPLKSPMPGKIQKVFITKGEKVKAKQSLVMLEAMKMEYTITIPEDAVVTSVNVNEGEQVKEGQILFVVEEKK